MITETARLDMTFEKSDETKNSREGAWPGSPYLSDVPVGESFRSGGSGCQTLALSSLPYRGVQIVEVGVLHTLLSREAT